MSITTSTASPEQMALPNVPAPASTSSFDERWSAWQARGAAHERAVRRRLVIAAPIVAVVAATLYFLLLA
jgi:hypothetical protein